MRWHVEVPRTKHDYRVEGVCRVAGIGLKIGVFWACSITIVAAENYISVIPPISNTPTRIGECRLLESGCRVDLANHMHSCSCREMRTLYT